MKYHIDDDVLADIRAFARKNGIRRVVLFGSRARGTHSPRSDIDLAATGGNVAEFHEDLEEKARTLLMFDVVNVDTGIEPELSDAIRKDGVVIYEEV